MSWIKVDENLPDHPKILKLSAKTKLDPDLVVGRLFRFWRWCLRFAEDGDLRGGRMAIASRHVLLNQTHLVACRLVDRVPYLRVHDWWDYAGPWLVSKYRRSPEKWESVRDKYSNSPVTSTVHATGKDRDVETYGRTDVKDVRTDVHQDARARSLEAPALAQRPTPQEIAEGKARVEDAVKKARNHG